MVEHAHRVLIFTLIGAPQYRRPACRLLGFSFPLTTMTEDPQVWSSVFYWVNYDSEPTMEWPQAKYITYTNFMGKYQRPKIVGYVQFSAPIKSEILSTIHPNIYWTKQRLSNSACMRYIERINTEEHGELTILGTHWPIKSYTPTATPAPSPVTQEQNSEPTQPELKKKTPTAIQKKPRAYQQQPLTSPWQNQSMWGQPQL